MSLRLHRCWQAIAHFLGETVAFPGDLDRALLAEVARVHRLEGALAEPRLTPRSPRPHVPPELWTRWQAAHAAGVAQAVRRAAPLRGAIEALAPIPVVVFKGAALAELLYPTPGARGMGDVDLLVPREDLPAALYKLEVLGYRRKYPGHPVLDYPGYHERQLEGPMELDLHQAFIQPERLAIDYAAIFARAIRWPALGPNALLLSPEDAVVHGCLHAAIGELTPTWAPAIGLLDLRLMLRRGISNPSLPHPSLPRERERRCEAFWGAFGPALEAERIQARAEEWGTRRMLYCVLEVARRLFPSLDPSAGSAPAAPIRVLLDALIVSRAFPPPLADPSRAEVLLRKGLLLRPADRFRFVLHTLERRYRESRSDP